MQNLKHLVDAALVHANGEFAAPSLPVVISVCTTERCEMDDYVHYIVPAAFVEVVLSGLHDLLPLTSSYINGVESDGFAAAYLAAQKELGDVL